jgi:Spy/CpxP family protein refolding chaperone
MSRTTWFAALLAIALAAPAFGQDSGGRGSHNRSSDSNSSGNNSSSDQSNRGRGGFDPSQYINDMKDRLGATDDEWKVIQPKLQKVWDARRENMSMMFGGRRRSSDSNSSDSSKSSIQSASQELRDILDKKDATPEEINAKLTAFREARDKNRAALVTAQKELKEVLTARQEAVLVSRGMLD